MIKLTTVGQIDIDSTQSAKSLFDNDEKIEESLLKAWWVLDDAKNEDKIANEDVLVMSLLVSDSNTTLTSLIERLSENGIDEQNVRNAIDRLTKAGSVHCENDEIRLTNSCREELDEKSRLKQSLLDEFVDDFINTLGKDCKQMPNNQVQIRRNVKDCLIYYIRINALAIFDVDNQIDFLDVQDKIKSIAKEGLADNREFEELVLYGLGMVVERPTESQKAVLALLAKEYVMAQVLRRDPMLRDFKLTKLGGKEFILDTDILLMLMAENLPQSKAFSRLLSTLLYAGCKIYCPREVMLEVYDHAEAAKRRYSYDAKALRAVDTIPLVSEQNLFIDDFMRKYGADERTEENWNRYIENVYEKNQPAFTYEVIRRKLDSRIQVDSWPCEVSGAEFKDNTELWQKVEDAAYEATSSTERGKKRNPEHNRRIAKTDTQLYLTAYYRNINNPDRGSSLKGILRHRTYVLTESNRIYQCGKNHGIVDRFLCNPRALLLYMSSAGLLKGEQINAFDLFSDNVLLKCIGYLNDDIDKFVKCGLDIRGKSGVRLHYDLSKKVENLLCNIEKGDSVAIRADVSSISKMGYTFENEVEKMQSELEQLQQENEKLRSWFASEKQARAKEKYDNNFKNRSFKPRKRKR